jgi:hypothetical protein
MSFASPSPGMLFPSRQADRLSNPNCMKGRDGGVERDARRERKIRADITGVFISGFQIKFLPFSFFFPPLHPHDDSGESSESDDAEKRIFAFFLSSSHPPPSSSSSHEMIMMIEEMDSKGDGRINKTIFHLHQASFARSRSG